MNKRSMLTGVLLLGLTMTAQARDHDRDRPRDRERDGDQTYLGAGFADFSVKEEDFGYEADDNGFKLVAGFEFGHYFAAELGYLGGATIVDEGSFDTEEVDLHALTGSLVGRLPITDTISVFGKVGVARYQMDFRWRVDGDVVDTDRFRDDEFLYGVGLTADIGRRFQVRGEYEAIDKAFDVISISGVFKFR